MKRMRKWPKDWYGRTVDDDHMGHDEDTQMLVIIGPTALDGSVRVSSNATDGRSAARRACHVVKEG
jgi:hypothetical protein